MFRLLAQLLKALLWYLGVGRKKSEEQRHEETAAREAELEVRNEDLEQALAAEKKARETESRMEQAQKEPPSNPPRKAKPGQKVFLLILLPLLCSGISCASCHPNRGISPPPLRAGACPRIPLTPEPRLPDITIPEQQDGTYRFTQEELDSILSGIDALKQDNKALRGTIEIYNEAYATRKEK